MKAAALFLALALIPGALAGTSSDPEMTDPADDKQSTIPGLGATSVEITKGWVAAETPEHFLFKLDVGGDFTPDPTETLAYAWTVDHAGATVSFGAEVFQTSSTSITATGEATAVDASGGVLTLTVPRTAFADIAPGQKLEAFTASATAYVVSPEVWNDSDSATGTRAYVIGSQADDTMDFDGDGHSDAAEIAAGTDPTDADDPPPFVEPVITDALAASGTWNLVAESAISETYVGSWNQSADDVMLTYDATINAGSVQITLEDDENVLAQIDLTASIADNETFVATFPGTWNLTVATTGFQGTLDLSVVALAADGSPETPAGSDDETGADSSDGGSQDSGDSASGADDHDGHDGDSDESAPETDDEKSTPFPALIVPALAAALLRRR